jgi:hypothetical protein
MSRFSPQISSFLKQVGVDPYKNISVVPKSDSCGVPGDFLMFKYKHANWKEYRVFLVIEPITKSAKTGSLLLTGFKLPMDRTYTPASFENLYNNKELPQDSYKTYIMSKMYGPLRKISKPKKEEE